MKKLVPYGKIIGIFLIVMMGIVLVSSDIYYFFDVNYKTISIILLMSTLLLFLIMGFLEGKRATVKGYKAGLKIGFLFIILFLIINVLVIKNFNLIMIMYYGVLLLSSTLGGMIGINRKKK